MSTAQLEKKKTSSAIEIVGYWELDKHLRSRLRDVSNRKVDGLSLRKLSDEVAISRSYLMRYKDNEQDVCLRIMNRLANYFDIKYRIGNFSDEHGSIS